MSYIHPRSKKYAKIVISPEVIDRYSKKYILESIEEYTGARYYQDYKKWDQHYNVIEFQNGRDGGVGGLIGCSKSAYHKDELLSFEDMLKQIKPRIPKKIKNQFNDVKGFNTKLI